MLNKYNSFTILTLNISMITRSVERLGVSGINIFNLRIVELNHVIKSIITTKAFTKIITATNSVNEAVANSYCSS